jgi:hypothetical protein
MTGGLIQLVAKGVQDIYITKDPQITFFKIVYRRHTNFSTEPIKQYFIHTPDFGKKSSCIIAKNGDLMGKSVLVVVLPKIKEFTNGDQLDPITKFAWVRKISYALVKSIEIEIGGQLIDKHYGEWLNIWAELTTLKGSQYQKMIGNVKEVYDYTNGKDEYKLYIPLSFWFSRSNGLALPLISLQYSEVKINVEINDLDKCYLTTPTNYIEIENDLINFKPFEYIEQNIDGVIASGFFTYYDNITKRLYYSRISRNKFQSMPFLNENTTTPKDRRALVYDSNNIKYLIRGLKSGGMAMPRFNSMPQTHTYNKLRNVFIKDCYLIIDYIYLDQDERARFVQTRHDYLIEQLIYIGEKTIESSNRTLKMDVIQPSKFMVWILQYSYLLEKYNNDLFNYTDNYKYQDVTPSGKSIVKEETFLLNGQERLSFRNYSYFNYLQAFQHFSKGPQEGINIYNFSLFPEMTYTSGTCSMSQIDNVNIRFSLSSDVNITNDVKFRGYSLSNNIFRISNGLSGLVFEK